MDEGARTRTPRPPCPRMKDTDHVTEAAAAGPPIATVRPRTTVPSRIVTLVAVLVPPLGVLAAIGLLWEVAVRPVDVIMLVVLYVACGLGITVGFHRLFSHKAFETTPAVAGSWRSSAP